MPVVPEPETDPERLRAEARRMAENHDQVVGWLRLAESRLRAAETTLANIGAPTHDAEGVRLNANGRLVDWLAGRRSEGWIGPDPMRELRDALQSVDDHLTNGQSGDVQPGERCKHQARDIARAALGRSGGG